MHPGVRQFSILKDVICERLSAAVLCIRNPQFESATSTCLANTRCNARRFPRPSTLITRAELNDTATRGRHCAARTDACYRRRGIGQDAHAHLSRGVSARNRASSARPHPAAHVHEQGCHLKAARVCGRTAPERDAVVIDRFFYTKQKALAWIKAHPHFMTVRVCTPNTKGAY